jgi:mRNA interferase RelE/StbE
MSYVIELSRSAEKEIHSLPANVQSRVENAIDMLAENPRPQGHKKLQGGGYRVRVGDYRIVYDIEDRLKIVAVVKVAHRKDAYR